MDIKLSDHFSCGMLLRFAIPNIGILLADYIFELVDGFFIVNFLGTVPFAAINLVMPILLSSLALALMFGFGGGSLIARTMGEGNAQKAKEYFSMLVMSSFLTGVVVAAAIIAVLPEASIRLGATSEMLAYCITYGTIVTFGLPFGLLNASFQSYFAAAEKAKIGFYISIFAGVINIVLDYLLLTLGYGIAGVAFATVVSMFLGGCLPICYFLRKNPSRLRLVRFHFELSPLLNTFKNGLAEFVSNVALSIVFALYNYRLMDFYGDVGVAAMGIIGYADEAVFVIFNGFTMAVMPIMAYHYGAKNFAEVRNVLKKSILVLTMAGIFFSILCYAGGGVFVGIFASHDEVFMALTMHALFFVAISFVFSGVCAFMTEFFAGMNDGKIAGIIAFSRLFIFQIAGIFIVPYFLGAEGIWYVIPLAEMLACLMIMGCFWKKRREDYFRL